MERRVAKRYPRKLAVTFTEITSGVSYQGYSENLSVSGMFIVTAERLRAGSRLRIEVGDGAQVVTFEGVVARVFRVPPALRAVQKEGMGVRFIQVAALVRGLLPLNQRPVASMPLKAVSLEEIGTRLPPVGEAHNEMEPPFVTALHPDAPAPSLEDDAEAPDARKTPQSLFPVHLHSEDDLLDRFASEIRYGGVKLEGGWSLEIDDPVIIEFHLLGIGHPLRAPSRVVHVDRTSGHFAVEFEDRKRIVNAVEILVG